MTQNKLHSRIASAFLFVLACVTSTIAADKLSIGYLSSTGQGKFFIAKDAGIFKKKLTWTPLVILRIFPHGHLTSI